MNKSCVLEVFLAMLTFLPYITGSCSLLSLRKERFVVEGLSLGRVDLCGFSHGGFGGSGWCLLDHLHKTGHFQEYALSCIKCEVLMVDLYCS